MATRCCQRKPYTEINKSCVITMSPKRRSIAMGKFCYKRPGEPECPKAQLRNVRVKFKHLVEIASAVRGKSLKRAQAYLGDVLARRECVPFRRFKGGVGQCAQAKQFKVVNGRWPVKAAKCMRDLLANAVANAEFFGKDPEELCVVYVQVNAAPVTVRKTFRAHGRINPYESHPSHVQLLLGPQTRS